MKLSNQILFWIGRLTAVATIRHVYGFTIPTQSATSILLPNGHRRDLPTRLDQSKSHGSHIWDCDEDDTGVQSRRKMMEKTVALASAAFLSASTSFPEASSAAVGTLPEFSETNAIVQGLTINVADASQQQTMIDFLVGAFDFQVQRQRIQGNVEETWLGFGPEQLSVPDDFELPVSAFGKYGGHASINVRYDSQTTTPFYRQGDDAPGDSIAYLSLGVPGYRISKMTANGGKILDAYGLINVVSPAGLPIRGVVGIAPDPIMYVAINCQDVSQSKEFYEKLGFVEQAVPYSRPSKGTTMFEPAPPKNSYYMSPSPNCMGVLLLQGKKKRAITPNPVVDSLNIVYNPSSEETTGEEMVLNDPSGIPIRFQPASTFTKIEKMTR
eukprot:jgi/Psemu1/192997/e_gw1.134.48.1